MSEDNDFLLILIEQTEDGSAEGVGVTLFVPGGVVSGEIIRFADYIKERAKIMMPNLTDEQRQKIIDDAPKADASKSPFILLGRAQLITAYTNIDLGLWRGRIHSISGMSFGRIVMLNNSGQDSL